MQKKKRPGTQINFLGTLPCKQPYVDDGLISLAPTSDDMKRIEDDIAREFTDIFDQSGSSIAWTDQK